MAKKVCLDAGWGGSQVGATGNGLKCKDINLNVVLQIGEILKKAGIEVLYTRTTDVNVSLSNRVKLANNNNVDLYVVVHSNAYKKTSAKGYETYYYKSSDKSLADRVHASVISDKSLWQSNRGVKKYNYYVLKNTRMPACMPVLGFITNSGDANIIKNKMDVFAKKIAEAICGQLGVSPDPVPPPPPPLPPPPPTIGGVRVSIANVSGSYRIEYSAKAGSGTLTHRLKLNNGLYMNIKPSISYDTYYYDGHGLGEGANSGQVEVRDGGGFAISPTFTISIPSDLAVTTPSRVDQHQGMAFSISYNVTGRNTNCTHELSDDGGATYHPIAPTKNGNTYTLTKSYSSMGTRSCKIRIKNNAGTVRESGSFIINIREPLKALSVMTSSDEYLIIKGNSLTIGTVSNRDVTEIKLSTDNGNSYSINGTLGSNRVTVALTSLGVGVYTCKLKAKDGYNQECVSNTFTITVTNAIVSDAFEIIEVLTDKNIKANEYTKVAIKVKAKKTLGTGVVINPQIKYTGGQYNVKNIQFEKGSVFTDWDKSTSDTDAEVGQAQDDALTAKEKALLAENSATQAKNQATEANNKLADIASDSKLTPSEKQQVDRDMQSIMKEKPSIDRQADIYGVSKTQYGNKYSSLYTYIYGAGGLLSSMSSTSNINSTEFKTKFNEYYVERQNVLDAIANKTKQYTDDKVAGLVVGGRNYVKGTSNKKTIAGANASNQTVNIGNFTSPSDLAGKEVTTSFKYRVSGSSVSGTLKLQTASGVYLQLTDTISLKTGEYAYSKTVTLNASNNFTYLSARFDNFVGSIEIYDLQVEIGNKPSAWKPAHEDIMEYADSITGALGSDLQGQLDGKIETHSQTSDPSTQWTTADLKTQHKGDLWYHPTNKITKRWTGSAWETLTDKQAEDANKLAQSKKRVFTSTPTTPYDVGDIYFTNVNGNGDLHFCKIARSSGSYTASDWVKGTKYTDDSVVNNFVNNTYSKDKVDLQNQLDKKTESFYQTSMPHPEYTNVANNNTYNAWIGDMWYNSTPSVKKTYIYAKETYGSNFNYRWQQQEIPKDMFDMIDGKKSVYTTKPVKYSKDDLWIVENDTVISGFKQGDILTSSSNATSFSASHWSKKIRYTDDTIANQAKDYAQNAVNTANKAKEDADKSNIKHEEMANDNKLTPVEKQSTKLEWDVIVGEKPKIESEASKFGVSVSNYQVKYNALNTHLTPLLGNLSTTSDIVGSTHRLRFKEYYDARQDVLNAISSKAKYIAEQAQNTADGKNKVFNSQPVPPYKIGDLWVQGSNGDIMRCKTARLTGNYVSADWEKASSYTNDDAIKLVNNFSISGTTNRWSPAGSSGNDRLVVVSDAELGYRGDITTSGNTQVISEYFEIDPTKTYKLGLMMKNNNNDGTGSYYFGIHAYDKDKNNIGVFTDTSSTLNTNPYFVHGSQKYANWTTFEGYVYGANTSVSLDTPKGNVFKFFKLSPKTKYLRVRFLNYRGSGYGNIQLGTIAFGHPTVTQVDNVVNDFEKRIKSAEQKITPESIKNTVTSMTESNGKPTFVQTSTMEQTLNQFEFKFTQAGGENMLSNSTFEQWIEGWYHFHWQGTSGHTYKVVGSPNDWIPTGMTGIRIAIPNQFGESEALGYGVGQNVTLKAGITYTLSGYSASHRVTRLICEIKALKKDGTVNHFASWYLRTGGGDHTIAGMGERWGHQFTTPDDKDIYEYMVVFWIAGCSSSGNPVAWLSQLQIEEGSVKTPWKAKANEVYSNITTINKDGVKVSMDEGEGGQGYTLLSHDGLAVKKANGENMAYFGQGNTAQIGELTVSGRINNRYLIKKAIGRPSDFYVGVNSTGDGTGRNAENKSNSVNHTLNWIADTYGCYSWQQDIRIHVDNGTYSENIYIGGWIGTGVIELRMGTWTTLYGSITVEECTMHVTLDGQRGSFWDNNGCVIECRRNPAILVRNSTCVVVGFRSRPSQYPNYGMDFIKLDKGADVYVLNNDVVKYWGFVWSSGQCTFRNGDNRGDVYYLADTYFSGEIYFLGTYHPIWDSDPFKNTWNSHTVHGNNPYNSAWIPKDIPPPPPPPVENWQWVEQSFSVSNLRSIPEGSGSGTSSRTGLMGQGRYSSYKPHRGWGDFGGVSSWCSGGRNFTVYLTLRRENSGHGIAGATPRPHIRKPDGNHWDCGVGFARGDTKTITLESSIANAIVNGSMTNIGLWAGTNTNMYSFYDIATIKVKCQKKV